MGKCEVGTYTTNIMVTHGALVCHGGFGQPQCEFFEQCCEDNNYKVRKRRNNNARSLRKKKHKRKKK